MTISVYSTKGGVGKTSISQALSRDLKMKYLTNDRNISMLSLNKAKFLKSESAIIEDNTIYDFGGFDSDLALNISKEADLLIIPTISEINSMMRTIELIKKINHNRIFLVATMVDSDKDVKDIERVITHKFPERNISIIFLSRTKIFKNALEKRSSVSEIFEKNKMYRKAFEEYSELLIRILELKDSKGD